VDILAAIRDLDWEVSAVPRVAEEADEAGDIRLESYRLCAANLREKNVLLIEEITAIRANVSRLCKSNACLNRRLELISCAAFFVVAATALAWVVWMVRG
jgi:hypothetical protein